MDVERGLASASAGFLFFWLSSLDESDEESFFFMVAAGVAGFGTGVTTNRNMDTANGYSSNQNDKPFAATAGFLVAGAASLSESLLLLGGAGFFTGVEGGFAADVALTGVDGAVFFFFASSSDESESDELSFFLFADKLAGGGIAAFGITTRQRCSSDDHNVISVPLETAGLLLVAASLSESSLLDEIAFFAAGVVGLAGVATGFFLVSSSDESESDELSFFAAVAFVAGGGLATTFVAGVIFAEEGSE